MKLLFILAWWYCLGYVHANGDHYSGVPQSRETVFGIELSVDGALCAASFPNDRIETVARITGSPEYRNLMRRWHSLCTARDYAKLDEVFPRPSDELKDQFQRKWNDILKKRISWFQWVQHRIFRVSRNFEALYDLDFYPEDLATDVLTDMLNKLKTETIRVLRNRSIVVEPERPFAEFALPGWFFEQLPVYENTSDSQLEEDIEVTAKRFVPLLSRISTAIHRAGFRRTGMNDVEEIMRSHYLGESRFRPVAAPRAAFQLATLGSCSGRADIELCMGRREQERRKTFATITLETEMSEPYWQASIVSLWLEHLQGNLSTVQSKSWSSAALDIRLDELLDSIAQGVATSAKSPKQASSKIPVVLTGVEWSLNHTSVLQAAFVKRHMNVELLDVSETPYLAAINAAEEARVYQRSYWVSHPPLVNGYPEPIPFIHGDKREL